MNNSGLTTGSIPRSELVADEKTTVEKAVHAILGGIRNYAVFPPDHPSTESLLQGVSQAVESFTRNYGDLSLEVERQSLLYREKPLYVGEAIEDNPAFVLYRDEIRRIEFLDGVNEEELAAFFRIFNHYRVIPEEPEDDLATALWRANLLHIHYEASIELWDNESPPDLYQFSPADPDPGRTNETVAAAGQGWESIRPDSSKEEYRDMSLGSVVGGQKFWSLTAEEEASLADLLKADQEHDGCEAATRLMFLVLRKEEDPKIYASVLSYLREVLRAALGGQKFRRAYYILDNVRKSEEILIPEKPWTVAIHNQFNDDIVSPATLEATLDIWPVLTKLDSLDIKTFVAVLQLLPTKAGVALAGMLDRIDSKPARRLITEIIASYATRDHQVLETLLESREDELVLRLIRVLRDTDDIGLKNRLLEKLSHHPQARIREEAHRLCGQHDDYR